MEAHLGPGGSLACKTLGLDTHAYYCLWPSYCDWGVHNPEVPQVFASVECFLTTSCKSVVAEHITALCKVIIVHCNSIARRCWWHAGQSVAHHRALGHRLWRHSGIVHTQPLGINLAMANTHLNLRILGMLPEQAIMNIYISDSTSGQHLKFARLEGQVCGTPWRVPFSG